MSDRKTLGERGEQAAEAFYRKNGFTVVARNYACGGGELDVVAFRRGLLVFAEVKTRASDTYGTPMEAVTAVKIQRCRAAAREFLREQAPSGKLPVWCRLLRRPLSRKIKATRNDIIEIYAAPSPDGDKLIQHANAF